jgi:hypothetical protein
LLRSNATIKEQAVASTNAQRQAAYRTRHLKTIDGTGERLNMLVDTSMKRSLERLPVRYGVTQTAMLKTLMADAEKAMLDKLPATQQAEYYASQPMKSVTQ